MSATPSDTPESASGRSPGGAATRAGVTLAGRAAIYAAAFVTGAIVMSFEMLGSRYVNPYFGSGIHTWAALISTVLAALSCGYFAGGWLADRSPTGARLGALVVAASLYLVALPLFADVLLARFAAEIDDARWGVLISASGLMFVPVALLGMYSPYAIRLLLRSTSQSGRVSGLVYGISTAGSIAGTLVTTFILIPTIGSRAITLALGGSGIVTGLLLGAVLERRSRLVAGVLAICVLAAAAEPARAEELLNLATRAELLKRQDGQIAHIETVYNDIFITKERSYLVMSFQKSGEYMQSAANLRDPDELALAYARDVMVSLAYAENPRRILVLGLGGGTIPVYLARHMPDAIIDAVELDPGVIAAAKTYFGIGETRNVHYFAADGRVWLNRHPDSYDLIIVDVFRKNFVPFHFLTREFYALLKRHLRAGGAAAVNIVGDTRVYASSLITLRSAFASVDLIGDETRNVIAIASDESLPREVVERRAAALQERYRFRYPLPELLAGQMAWPKLDGDVLTDDFAPADVFATSRRGGERAR